MENRPAIEFPCDDYPIRVICERGDGLVDSVVEIVRSHDAGFQAASVSEQPSRKGTYVSVRIAIRATGERQLRALHADLMAHPMVKLVL
jgi:hypothetical protein